MVTASEPTKQPLKVVRGILPEKKMPHGWPACLKKTPPKVAFQNNDIYIAQKDEDDHHYEEPKETQEPQEKNMRVFYRLKINDENNDISNLPHEDEYNDENYESVEERETTN